jgi:hypothetical protein
LLKKNCEFQTIHEKTLLADEVKRNCFTHSKFFFKHFVLTPPPPYLNATKLNSMHHNDDDEVAVWQEGERKTK